MAKITFKQKYIYSLMMVAISALFYFNIGAGPPSHLKVELSDKVSSRALASIKSVEQPRTKLAEPAGKYSGDQQRVIARVNKPEFFVLEKELTDQEQVILDSLEELVASRFLTARIKKD